MSRQSRVYRYEFRGHDLFPPIGSGAGSPFASKVTSSGGGIPTIQGANGGGLAITLGGITGVENACVYQGDILPWDIDDIIRAEFIVKGPATVDSTTSIAWGLTGARNDAIDSIAQAAIFRVIGDNTVVVETDDGTTDNDDVATGLSLSSTFKRFAIDFGTGVYTREPPSVSLGGKANIQFFGANANGSLRRVASGTRFDMSAYTGGLQFFFQVQKTSDDNADAFTILECSIEVKLPNA